MSPNADLVVVECQVGAELLRMESINGESNVQILTDDDHVANLTMLELVPPNGGYGWVCTLGVFLINAHTWGINSSWAVIMAHYSVNSTQLKATHLEYALIGGLALSQALILSPIVTACLKHVGLRSTLLLGTGLIFIGLMTSSIATHIWQLFLTQGLCFGWGMGFLYVTASALLPPWFSTRRSLAVGLATSGSGIGGLVYSLATNAAIQSLGVGWAYRILACCALAANLVSSLLLRECGGRRQILHDELRFNHRLFGRVEVLLVVVWGVTTELGYITLLYSLPSYASSVGLTATQGSIANALLNLGLGLGRPLVGYFSDTLGRINMALAMTALCAVICFALWIPAQTFALLAIFAMLAGALCGTFWSTLTPVLVEVVGMRKLASTFGVICLSMVLPTTFAEPVAMQLVETGGEGNRSFKRAQVFVGCMFMTGAASLWLLRCWKIFGVETERAGIVIPATSRSRYWAAWLTPRLLFRFWHV